jgi:hypothetical protein
MGVPDLILISRPFLDASYQFRFFAFHELEIIADPLRKSLLQFSPRNVKNSYDFYRAHFRYSHPCL